MTKKISKTATEGPSSTGETPLGATEERKPVESSMDIEMKMQYTSAFQAASRLQGRTYATGLRYERIKVEAPEFKSVEVDADTDLD